MVPRLGRFALTFLFLASLIACGKGGGVTAPDVSETPAARVILPPLPPVIAERIFGYYAYGSDGAGCGWSNWTLVTVNSQSVNVAREKAEAARACRQVVSYAPVGPWKHWQDTFRPIAQAFADAGVLHSVYVADEPMATGMGYAELAQRIADVRAAGFKAMFTEQGGGIEKPHPAVDYYGLDWYDTQPRWFGLVLHRHPEINVLVAPAFGGMPYPDQGAWWAQAKQARVGLVFWMWPSVGGFTGAEEMPEVQAIHRALWARW